MVENNQNLDHGKLENLIKENLILTKNLNAKVEKINRYIFWHKTWGFIKILIIVIPIVLGIIYLPPIFKKVFAPYQNFFNTSPSSEKNSEIIDLLNKQFKINVSD